MTESANLQAITPLPTLDIFAPGYFGEDRYALLAELRERDVPLAVDSLGSVNLLRYADVRAAFEDKDRFLAMETAAALAMGMTEGPFFDFQSNVVLTQNPPRHTQVRTCAAKFFRGRRIIALETSIREACDELIDAFPEDEPFDFVDEFAFKLPVGVIMRLLHLPKEDEARIREWSPRTIPAGPGTEQAADEANAHMREYAEEVIAARRARPLEDDIITDLVRARDGGELDDDDLWALVVALMLAGHETTTSTLSTGMLALLRHPDQMGRLRADQSLTKNAVEEMLRLEPAVNSSGRVLREDVELHGVRLEAGSFISLNQASANHDPRVFADADRFDISRPNAREHLTFGGGIHRCIGAPLAQFEIPIAVERLLDRLESIEVVAEPTYAPTFFRGFSSLPLQVTRSRQR